MGQGVGVDRENGKVLIRLESPADLVILDPGMANRLATQLAIAIQTVNRLGSGALSPTGLTLPDSCKEEGEEQKANLVNFAQNEQDG